MNERTHYLSLQGQVELRQELEQLVGVRRVEVAERLHDAMAQGDLSENAEYEDAKNEQAFLEGRIAALTLLLRDGVLIAPPTSLDHVQIGSTVLVSSSEGSERYTIVGARESAPAQGRISNESPLGRVLLGRGPGETVSVKTPGGPVDYQVLAIS
jgi:transcription elongation factor GreA